MGERLVVGMAISTVGAMAGVMGCRKRSREEGKKLLTVYDGPRATRMTQGTRNGLVPSRSKYTNDLLLYELTSCQLLMTLQQT